MKVLALLTDWAQFFRMSSYFSSLCPLLGGFALARPVPARSAVVITLVAFGFHVFSSVTNDIRDRSLDATDPRRAHMPIASGRVPVSRAWLAVTACSGGGLALAAGTAGLGAAGLYVAACALVGAYNVLGKVTTVPFVADLLCGAAFGTLVLLGGALSGGEAPGAGMLALSVCLYLAQITGVHGPVRDYDNDRRHDVRTTVGWLCRYEPALPQVLPRRVTAVALAFQAATAVAFTSAALQADAAIRGALLVGLVMQALAFAVTVVQAVRNDRVERQARLAVPVTLLTLLSYATPVLAHWHLWQFMALLAACTVGWFLSPAGRGRVYRRSVAGPEPTVAGGRPWM